MIRLYYTKKKYLLLPEKFEELTGKQFIRLAPLLFDGGEELNCEVQAVRILSGLSWFRWSILDPEIVSRAMPYVKWLFEEIHITRQLILRYRGYHGPTSDFDNLRMKEFHLTELNYRQLVTTKDKREESGTLNNLVAILYRPGKKGYDKKRDPDGDIRQDFNHNELPFHARIVSKWPPAIKQAIFIWYDSCRQDLIDQNPLVFKEPSANSYESQFDVGLYGMMRSLAGEKLGPIEKVENMYVQTACMEIGLMKEEEKHIEEQIKTQRKNGNI